MRQGFRADGNALGFLDLPLGSKYAVKPVVQSGRALMSFALYVVGFVIMVIGLALGGYYLRVPQHWIVVGVVVLVGLGILTGATMTRHRDPS